MPRILVIDDQSGVRAMISIVLRVNQFDVVEAASGDAGLKAFENSSFDLAIVDIFLQGTNGFDVIAIMRERVPDLPVVAMSGMTTLDFVSELPELANLISLQKPFRPNELIRAIEAASRLSRPSAAESMDVALSPFRFDCIETGL
jgi:DNA-binding response OmpR family regulator